LEGKLEALKSQVEINLNEISNLKNENDNLRSQLVNSIKSQEMNVLAVEYKELSVKYKTQAEEKEKQLNSEKEKNEWLLKDLQRAKNELFAVKLEKDKKEKELFNSLAQLKDLQAAVEFEREKRKKIEEDHARVEKMIQLDKPAEPNEEQSLISAVKELGLIILSKVFLYREIREK